MKYIQLDSKYLFILLISIISTGSIQAQKIFGRITDNATNEPLIGANVIVQGTTNGTVTDYDGNYELKVKEGFPVIIEISYLGYADKVMTIEAEGEVNIPMGENAIVTEVVEVKGQRISDKQKAAPLTVESMDLLAIKETAADNFYDGLGAMKGVDLTAASLGFKVINTRGFNSTSPVRSLQIIDGVDNQAPGLNFSLGNFLGSSDLDVLKVDIVQGASSAFFGPGAFNGVIAMETKNPFLQKGLSASLKGGERNLIQGAIRWADVIKNKNGEDFIGYKLNFSYLRADDWEATNYQPVDDSRVSNQNPGRWDAVNIYGDEYFRPFDLSGEGNLSSSLAGLGIFYRTGFEERDLVDYDTRNTKANAALHIRTHPSQTYESPELILSSSFGSGTTVYQGDNRFSLRDILFFQNRIEYRKKDKWFIRAYSTNENAGDSYDPYFTALRMQELSKSSNAWGQDYNAFWQDNIYPRMLANEYPIPTFGDTDASKAWLVQFRDSLAFWHTLAAEHADLADDVDDRDRFIPGTDEFNTVFDSITSLKNTEGGTRFFDESALYHISGEYIFTPEFVNSIRVGGNARWYQPFSDGTVFSDTSGTRISNFEYGLYTGVEKNFSRKYTVTATLRMDKNENFDYLFTPAMSFVYSPNSNHYLRTSFSSGVRNPTLTDQYLNLNVGPATLLGNLNGFNDLITTESFIDFFENPFATLNDLDRMDIAPVKPEKVKTIEFGYRGTLFDKLYVDGSYYYNWYRDFIGFNIGIQSDFDIFGFPINPRVFRVAANSTNLVTTQGFSVGLNYYLFDYYKLGANYSYNRLNKTFEDDPIVPAFNTPEHKYNLSFSGRKIPINLGFKNPTDIGFNINYKWVEGFLFEGSPQFTGFVDSYGLLDAQLSIDLPINTTMKIGASNLLDNRAFQTFGGPQIGRLAYVSFLYEFKKK